MGRRFGIGVVALACAAGAGCSLLVDTAGLSGSPEPPTEAGSPADANEAAAVADAGSETSTVDAGEAGLCDDSVLCDDFEGTSTVPWTTFDVATGGTLARDTVRPRSGMRSLHCVRTKALSGRAYLQAAVAPANLTCELDVFAEGVPAGENVEVFTLRRTVNGFATYEPGYVFLRPSGALLGEYKRLPDGGEMSETENMSIPGGGLDHWVHLTIAITATTSKLDVSVEGVPAGSISLTLTETAAPPTDVQVGLTYGTNGATPTVFVDNVVCRAR